MDEMEAKSFSLNGEHVTGTGGGEGTGGGGDGAGTAGGGGSIEQLVFVHTRSTSKLHPAPQQFGSSSAAQSRSPCASHSVAASKKLAAAGQAIAIAAAPPMPLFWHSVVQPSG